MAGKHAIATKERVDITALEKDATRSAAYKWIESSLPEARKYAKEKIKAIVYTSNLMKAETPELVERISLNLPPNEIGIFEKLQPVRWASAFNASWFYLVNDRLEKANGLD